MRLVAKKPCNFGGKKFFIGDEVPVELVVNPNHQIALGTLSKLNGSVDAEPGSVDKDLKVIIPIYKDDNVIELAVTPKELVVFTDIKQIPNKKTEDIQKIEALIKEITSNDLLILLDALDGRKVVSEAARTRAEELSTDSDDDEEDSSTGDDETSGDDEEDSSTGDSESGE